MNVVKKERNQSQHNPKRKISNLKAFLQALFIISALIVAYNLGAYTTAFNTWLLLDYAQHYCGETWENGINMIDTNPLRNNNTQNITINNTVSNFTKERLYIPPAFMLLYANNVPP